MRGRTPYSENMTTRVLRKILVNKVVSESELLKIIGSGGICNARLNKIYRWFVASGFPIKKRILEKKWTQHGKTTSACNMGKIDHRVVIYYVE